MKDKTEVIIKCADNCSCMSVDKWDDDEEYFITFYNAYYDSTFGKKLGDIWKIIRGRQISTSELVVSKEDYEKLRNFNKDL